MTDTTFFYHKSGLLSSIRSTTKTGNGKMNLTYYPESGIGGSTFYSKHYISRINNYGQCLSSGFFGNGKSTYIGDFGKMSSRIAPYK